MKNLFLLLSLILAVSCAQKKEISQSTIEKNHFGVKIDDKGAISYDMLLEKLETADEINDVKVEGKVEGVCQKKGCWMNIVSEDADKEPMFVKFKDYGFFMPLDIAGETVIMHGKAFKEKTSVEELRHYAEDNGDSPDEIAKITEPKVEIKFMADGVLLK